MPALRPADFLREENPGQGAAEPNLTLWMSEPGGLVQFGAFVEVLQPGTRSSLKHWHSDEDELVYVLEGEVTLVEGDTRTLLRPGDAATFRAGVAVGHCLLNCGQAPTRCLVVGTRAPVDRVTYPDHDRVLLRDRSQPDDVWLDTQGRPADNPCAS